MLRVCWTVSLLTFAISSFVYSWAVDEYILWDTRGIANLFLVILIPTFIVFFIFGARYAVLLKSLIVHRLYLASLWAFSVSFCFSSVVLFINGLPVKTESYTCIAEVRATETSFDESIEFVYLKTDQFPKVKLPRLDVPLEEAYKFLEGQQVTLSLRAGFLGWPLLVQFDSMENQ